MGTTIFFVLEFALYRILAGKWRHQIFAKNWNSRSGNDLLVVCERLYWDNFKIEEI